MTMRKIC
jgi:hypothetical protein